MLPNQIKLDRESFILPMEIMSCIYSQKEQFRFSFDSIRGIFISRNVFKNVSNYYRGIFTSRNVFELLSENLVCLGISVRNRWENWRRWFNFKSFLNPPFSLDETQSEYNVVRLSCIHIARWIHRICFLFSSIVSI